MKIFVTNFKNKFTGVTTTAFTVAKAQAKEFGQDVTLLGNALGTDQLRHASAPVWPWGWQSLLAGADGKAVIHVRRDSEMWYGLWVRDVLRLPVKLVFTSANTKRRSWIGRLLMARMDAVIATSIAAAQALPFTPAAIIPHGINLDAFQPMSMAQRESNKHFTLACVGRVRAGKGTQNFVRAFIRVAHKRRDVHAVAFGLAQPQDQSFKQMLDQELTSAGVADRFTWAGEVPHAQMIPRLQACDVLVALPQYEPFGVTPIEAMAMGLPALCSQTGCFPDLIEPGKNGFLVRHDNNDLAAEKLLVMLDWPLREQSFVQALRGHVDKNFNANSEAGSILKVYKMVTQ